MATTESTYESVEDFYAGKSVFITGATGFLGKVLLEKLLYSCKNLDKIYVLIREKKNVSPEKRLHDIFKLPLFTRLNKERPSDLKKVIPIVGDIRKSNLELQEGDEKELLEKVDVVFHVAATVKFNETLATAMDINYEGTRRVLNLSKKMKHLKIFLYVSTVYANPDREVIEEIIYPPPATYNEVYLKLDHYGENSKQIKKLLCSRPNTYTFSKALAENYVAKHHGDIPTVIVRPSIVTGSETEPMEGWIDNWNGATALMTMIGKGHCRVVSGKCSNLFDLIPVDYVSNLCIVAAAKCKGTETFEVYNASTSAANPVTLGEICNSFISESVRLNLNEVPYPAITFIKSQWLLKIIMFIVQIIPAFIADIFLILTGKTPRFFKLQKKLLILNNVQNYFLSNSWIVDSKKVQALYASLSPSDQNLLPCDPTSIVWSEYLPVYYNGIRTYLY